MSKHTPGPWSAEIPENGAVHITAPTAGAGDVCDLYHKWRDESGEHIFTKDNAEANAHLLAAAPELLAALEGMLNLYVPLANSGDCGNWDPEEEAEVIAARAAIAKTKI